MIEGGFGFHGIWGNLIPWINKLDIDKIREKAGITENVEPGAFEVKHFGQSRAFFDFHTDSRNTISSGLF